MTHPRATAVKINPMRAAKILALVLVVLIVAGVLWATWLATGASTEACNNGEDIWLCSDGVAQGLVVGLVVFPIVALLVAGAALAARRVRRHRDSN
jgi:ABC-type Na+ efflux pump permease subunit